jgi:hypothetical protein
VNSRSGAAASAGDVDPKEAGSLDPAGNAIARRGIAVVNRQTPPPLVASQYVPSAPSISSLIDAWDRPRSTP